MQTTNGDNSARGSKDLWATFTQELNQNVDWAGGTSYWSDSPVESRGGVYDRVDKEDVKHDIWGAWDQGMDGGETRRDSPMKRRAARRHSTRNRTASQPRKRPRQDERVEPPNAGSTSNTPFNLEAEFATEAMAGMLHEGMDFEREGFDMDEEGLVIEEQIDEKSFDAYVAQFLAGNVGFVPIGTFLYVVQGWNKTKREPTVRTSFGIDGLN
ncbi:hypothetical protein V5O48_008608 [Marasmius crinis-equi]|uniref:Uncharacterized protein n=1 Tax=Marasmius crinis-equi TaxID=585013 RepID=A0ABR3FDH3_9AGAR